MAFRTLAATVAIALPLAASARADGYPPPPTQTRIWLNTAPVRVVETASALEGVQATTVCEAAITSNAPTVPVRPIAPAKRIL